MRPADNDDNAGMCLCPDCPTYDECMGGNSEALYCARGKTPCTPTASGCICGECPVWAENSLSSYYFCMRGAAAE